MIAHNTADLKPGMALAQAVYDFHDVLLLKAGTELSLQNIRLLKSWGVNKVWIAGDEAAVPGAKDDQQAQRIRETVDQYLQAKFEDVRDDPIMAEIMRAAGHLITLRYLNRSEENETD